MRQAHMRQAHMRTRRNTPGGQVEKARVITRTFSQTLQALTQVVEATMIRKFEKTNNRVAQFDFRSSLYG